MKLTYEERNKITLHIINHLPELLDDDLEQLNWTVVAMLASKETHKMITRMLEVLKS